MNKMILENAQIPPIIRDVNKPIMASNPSIVLNPSTFFRMNSLENMSTILKLNKMRNVVSYIP